MYRALVPAMYVFCTIMWQEITMDINDEEGDRKAGIRTLPGTPCFCLPAPELCVARC